MPKTIDEGAHALEMKPCGCETLILRRILVVMVKDSHISLLCLLLGTCSG